MYLERRATIVLALSVFAFLAAIVLTEPVLFGLCGQEDFFSCQAPLEYTGQPLGVMAAAVGIISFVLLFLPRSVFSLWLKYVLVCLLPILILWIIYTPVTCYAALSLCVNKELATFLSAGIFVVISLIVIGIKYWQLHQQPPKNQKMSGGFVP